MGHIKDSNILFFVTSPRTPFKMIPEIKLLTDNLSGKPWNKITQNEFANLLAASNDFHGEAKNDKGFSARDRINRAPKGLGFVDLKPTIKLTDAGKLFVSSTRPNEIFIRQLLKFQLPSPYHIDKKNNYYIKPYLEMLRLIYDLGSLSKDEIRLFALQMVDYRMYDTIKNQIVDFRNSVKIMDRSKTSYKNLREKALDSIVRNLYKNEISEIHSSGTLKNFITKKKNNSRDYADACFRYLRATQLVTVNRSGSYLSIPSEKQKEVEYILATIDRAPSKFTSEAEYKNYLFNPTIPTLAIDDRDALSKILSSFGISNEVIESKSILELQDLQENVLENHKKNKVNETIKELKTFSNFDEIISLYSSIVAKEVTDQPLMLEWNTWRAFTMLNDGNISGNFKLDTEGMPLTTAGGNMADIECKYSDFNTIVEVTMSSGKKQYEMEGEPVARHLGDLKTKTSSNDNCYCIFIAPKVNEATLAHFFTLHHSRVKYYGGRSKIVPLDLHDFINMLTQANSNQHLVNSKKLQDFLELVCDNALTANDEEEWFNFIKISAANWLQI